VLTGDGRVDEIRRAHGARLSVVQCAGSMTPLAKAMQERYGIPFIRVSFFGIEDTADALYRTAERMENLEVMGRARALVSREITRVLPETARVQERSCRQRAGLYVGGAFKAFSLVRALRQLVSVLLAGTQTGSQEHTRSCRAPAPARRP